MARQHTDKEYEAELVKLREQLLVMGGRVEEMIASSIKALVERDTELAQKTIELDAHVNNAEVRTDELCAPDGGLRARSLAAVRAWLAGERWPPWPALGAT